MLNSVRLVDTPEAALEVLVRLRMHYERCCSRLYLNHTPVSTLKIQGRRENRLLVEIGATYGARRAVLP